MVSKFSRAGTSLTAFVLCIIILSCSRTDRAAQSAADSLAVIKLAPGFSAVNYDSTNFNTEFLHNQIWVASFMFSNCEGVCPVMNSGVAKLQKMYGDKGVKFVSLSVDPDRDSLPALSEYAQRYGAQKGTWFLLRMPLDSVRRISTDGFLLSDPVEPSAHSSRFVLVDKENNIRGYYDSMDSARVRALEHDLGVLLR